MQKIQRVSELYFKLVDEEIYYRMIEKDPQNAVVIELSEAGVIVYSSTINEEFFAKKFGGLKLLESSKEEFDSKYFEIKNKEENEKN